MLRGRPNDALAEEGLLEEVGFVEGVFDEQLGAEDCISQQKGVCSDMALTMVLD